MDGDPSRAGDSFHLFLPICSGSNVYVFDTQYDNLHIRQFTNLQNAAYNYSLESQIDNTRNNTYMCILHRCDEAEERR